MAETKISTAWPLCGKHLLTPGLVASGEDMREPRLPPHCGMKSVSQLTSGDAITLLIFCSERANNILFSQGFIDCSALT